MNTDHSPQPSPPRRIHRGPRAVRIRRIRRRVAAAAVASFALAWGVIVSGLDADTSSANSSTDSDTNGGSDSSSSEPAQATSSEETYTDPVTGVQYSYAPQGSTTTQNSVQAAPMTTSSS